VRDVSSEQRVLQGYLTLGLSVFAGHAKRAEPQGIEMKLRRSSWVFETGGLALKNGRDHGTNRLIRVASGL